MNVVRIGLGVGVVVIAVLVGARLLSPSQPSGPAVSPLPAPSVATATPRPAAVTDTLTGGRYQFGPFGETTIVATGPNGWVGYPSWAMDGPEPLRADAPNGIGIAFFTANGVFSDPCHWDVLGTGNASQPGDVAVGPTVDDLVAALRANLFYTSTSAKPVTIDGYTGQELELQLPAEPQYATCDKDDPNDTGGHVFVFSGPGLYAQGQANRWHVYILDVDGTRLISTILSYEGTSASDLALARNVIDTMAVNP